MFPFGLSFTTARPRRACVCKRSCVESNHRSSSAMLTCAVAHDVQTSFHCHVFEKSHDRICLRKCTRNPHMSPLIIGGSQVVITFPTTLLVLPNVIMVVSTWKADRVWNGTTADVLYCACVECLCACVVHVPLCGTRILLYSRYVVRL